MSAPLPPATPPGDRLPDSSGQGEAPRSVARAQNRRSLATRLSGLPQGEKRSPRAVAIAVGLHVVVGAVLIQALTFGHGIPQWLRFGNQDVATEERLTYVTPPAPVPPPKPVAQRPVPREVPPSTSPTLSAPPVGPVAPPPPVRPATPQDTGSGGSVGNGIGAIDPNTRGVKPNYNDERVWRGPVGEGGAGGGGTGVGTGDRADKLDSIMRGVLVAARDSLDSIARAQGRYGRAPGDWTKTDKNGNKWGWDQQGIRLGKVMIPNALLGLLPLNAATAAQMSGNPTAMARESRLAAGRADIQRMSERGMGEAEFKRIVKEMDKRRDAERRERLRAPSASVAAPVKTIEPKADK
ncbi:hypothetical protein [Gemmatimonas phototrophica]|uniref:hypothetical protein n=1 Tax=Gemmatimonas phototrophica TaxID=1379270 RepID=UPI0011AEB2AA|nr:hypothetical protein [Gemmatimonas phototrophica]